MARIAGSDYDGRSGLTEDEVISKMQPTEEFIIKVTHLAKQKLSLQSFTFTSYHKKS